MIDRLRCRILGHSWRPVFGVGGPWCYCHRCGDTSECAPPVTEIGHTENPLSDDEWEPYAEALGIADDDPATAPRNLP